MNGLALLLFLACAAAMFLVPRRWAAVPLLVGVCYMTKGQVIDVGPASLTIFRLLLLAGLIRILLLGERIEGGFNLIDKLLLGWGAWALIASFFHDWKAGAGPIFMSGVVFDQLLIYLLVRIWCRDLDDLVGVLKVLALLLVPVATAMLIEKTTSKNLFAVFGGVPLEAIMREGKLRAQACFRHPILAGTVGATVFPLMVAIWSRHPFSAALGMVACLVMVVASASSGPVMSLLFALGGLALWRWRHLVKPLLWGGAALYVLLAFVMSRPPYYLISRIDISGGSTGYHRAMLIEQTSKYLHEWWLFGTDRTRHWMPFQGAISDEHTDITNYYIAYGVQSGLLGLLLIVAILVIAIRWVFASVNESEDTAPAGSFPIWCCGCGLLAHAATSISVSYFDQSMVFFWLNVAVISSISASLRLAAEERESEAEQDETPDEIPLNAGTVSLERA